MGFLELFNIQAQTPTVPSVLPENAKLKILQGKIPILELNNLFLKNGEVCHYADRAIYEKRTVNKKTIRNNTRYSMPGLFKKTRIYRVGGNSTCVDDVQYSKIKGYLYITSKRIIFVGGSDGFDRKIEDLVAVTPYANCIELQFSKETLKLFVPDGNLPHTVLRLV